jgi:hypothetical protein
MKVVCGSSEHFLLYVGKHFFFSGKPFSKKKNSSKRHKKKNKNKDPSRAPVSNKSVPYL